MSKSRLLTVTSISEEKEDKNGFPYVTISVSQATKKLTTDIATGEEIVVKSPARTTAFNAWKHSYLGVANVASEKGVEIEDLKLEDIADVEPDFAYTLEVGDKVEGDICTREVEPYSIMVGDEEREVDIYSCAVLGCTTDPSFEITVKRTFERNNHLIVEDKLKDAVIVVKERVAKEEFAGTFQD